MKQKIVCVFAHPDDEAFGPGGTIAKFSQTDELYILCATKGEAGITNREKNIAEIRQQELLASAKILGVKEVSFLGFIDGTLSNSNYHDLANRIKKYLEKIKPTKLLTFEPRGVSGHIDHITVSLVTSYLFEHLEYVKELMYYCHTDWQVQIIKKLIGDYFIYFPPGYKQSDVNLVVDIKAVWQTKVEAMKKHQSQIHDVKMVLSFLEKMPLKEYFMVLSK